MFTGLLIIHVLIWLFVVFAFLNDKTAKFNLIFVIPIIYILHMLPFNILNDLKLITNIKYKEDPPPPMPRRLPCEQVCCRAMTASCMACSRCQTVAEYCASADRSRDVSGCPPPPPDAPALLLGFYYIKETFNNSFQNPLSPQGLLILGSITSYLKLILF